MSVTSGCSTFSSYVATCGVRELHILGVYEGTDRGPIAVALSRTGAALTIVVSGYEPTTWNFAVSPGVMIERVITNGLGEQTVLGLPPGTVVVDRSGGPSAFAGCAFVWPMDEDGCDTPGLVMGVEALTGLSTTSFSGCYSTSSFTLANP